MRTMRAKKKLTLGLDESGAAAVIVAIVFAVLCGAMGLAFDYGHMVMVKGQLQRTADAAALAGVMGFVPYNDPGTLSQAPNWANGLTQAHKIISDVGNSVYNDTAAGAQFSITEGTVLYGYWLLHPPTGYLQPKALPDPPLPAAGPFATGSLAEPAIYVNLSRNVNVYLARLVGVSSPRTVSAVAIAILPEAYETSKIPPIAINSKTYFHPDMTIDQSEKNIKIQVQKDISSWFNLNGTNDVPTTRINEPMKVGTTEIYLQPGAKATLTNFMKQGDTIVLPVVNNSDFSKSTGVPIMTWCAFHIEQLDANSMSGRFVNRYFDPNVIPTEGNGTIAAVGGTPKLVGP
jgi:hypothetical protein